MEKANKRIGLEAQSGMHEALLYGQIEGKINGKSGQAAKDIVCQLCSHLCHIKDGEAGKCLVRKNIGGKLYCLNWGKAAGLAIDPIEKKPFFHFKPGTRVLSFGTPGCNFRCLNCQNWDLSQGVKIGGAGALDIPTTSPRQIVDAAIASDVEGFAYTYSEPTIFFEYARDTILESRKARLPGREKYFHLFVSNGYFTKQMLDLVAKENLLQGIRIDLKFINEEKYQKVCGGRLNPVLENIKRVNRLRGKIALEVIALVIPTLNDSEEDLRQLCRHLACISKDIPLHFSRFHPDYKLSSLPPTSLEALFA
ncbi:AmmeMemoRadiSam system radical SAM enzyme, partial [Candidatus Parvarchaeota archaeon]|nr:AmmeMemoRadiSam system radical SAM enzyme [Candidatus Parvarchaeota archaeon]